MKILYSVLFLFLIVMLIFVLRYFSNDSLSTSSNINISGDENKTATVPQDVIEEDSSSSESLITENNNPPVSTDDNKEVSLLLQALLFEAMDINNLEFYSTVSSRIDFMDEEVTKPIVAENEIYIGSLFRYPEHASYSVSKSLSEYDRDGLILNDFNNKVNYVVNNYSVYFSDGFGGLNYFTFSKEDAFLETVGQLEKIVKLFQELEQFVTIYKSEDKQYVSLNIPEDILLDYTTFLTETVFNGYFDTKTKEETNQTLIEENQLNWPTKMYNHTIILVLTEDNKFVSYYIDFESDADGYDSSYRFYYKLLVSFFNINNVTIPEAEQKIPSEEGAAP